MLTAFIVDDELPAQNELKRFLSARPEFKIIGEAIDGAQALERIKTLRPEVVFLDIHIPQKNGLEVAAELSEWEQPPVIVFVTAYDQYAIQAFEVNAIDYMLKPYDQDRFDKSCEKILAMMKNRGQTKKQLENLRTYVEQNRPNRLIGHKRKSHDRVFIDPDDVLYFHVKLTEMTAYLKSGEEYLVTGTLKSLFEMLDPARFQQTHRAYVVNLDHVEKVSPLFSGNFQLMMKDQNKKIIPLSRRYARKLRQYLKW